jgi:hypothetical protein
MFQTNIFYADTLSASAYCFSLALAALVSTGSLLVWHLFLCLHNQTTLEFYIQLQQQRLGTDSLWNSLWSGSSGRNPFDEGWRKNLMRIFGDVPWYRNLWPSRHLPPPPKFPFELQGRDLKEYV